MNQATGAEFINPAEAGARDEPYYERDFWSQENLKFGTPHYRLEKAGSIIKGIAQGRECRLLDVGCGPATLRRVLPANIEYYGIDMAIHHPAPNLREADLVTEPIRFGDEKFDIVIAQGLFEYLGKVQSEKFSEIADLLTEGGRFVVTFWNYSHRNPKIYFAHNNVQPMETFRKDLARHFHIDRLFPSSHNWYHGSPTWKINRVVNMRFNARVPLISSRFAVEYFFVCSRLADRDRSH
jgi:SAM-dependent methyltransferase